VFGSRGSANFLSRSTAWLATIFFCLSLALAYLVHGERESRSIADRLEQVVEPAPAPAPAEEKTEPVIPE
jgi:preprotein translocase subunit SecG